jgi:hypothetical protein
MDTPASDPERAVPTSIRPVRELNELRAGSAASLAELREFLTQLKGRKPQEVIGIVSASLLVQSMATALLIVLGLLVVFTVGPYLVYGPPQPKKPATVPTSATPEIAAEVSATADVPAAAASATAAISEVPQAAGEPDLQQGSAAMGLDEAKQADPAKNPLDSPDLDKLLDGLDP